MIISELLGVNFLDSPKMLRHVNDVINHALNTNISPTDSLILHPALLT